MRFQCVSPFHGSAKKNAQSQRPRDAFGIFDWQRSSSFHLGDVISLHHRTGGIHPAILKVEQHKDQKPGPPCSQVFSMVLHTPRQDLGERAWWDRNLENPEVNCTRSETKNEGVSA